MFRVEFSVVFSWVNTRKREGNCCNTCNGLRWRVCGKRGDSHGRAGSAGSKWVYYNGVPEMGLRCYCVIARTY